MLCRKIAIIAFLIQLSLLQCVAHAQDENALREKSRRYAAIQAAKVAIEELPNREITGLVKESKSLMLENIGDHIARDQSERANRTFLHQRVKQTLEQDLLTIQERFKTQFDKNLYIAEKEDAVETYLRKKGPTIFKESRDAVITEQLGRISLKVYPSVQEVEDLDKGGWKISDKSLMKKRMLVRMRRSEKTLFQEVDDKINDESDKILEDIQGQVKAQQGALGEFKPDGRIVTSTQMVSAWRAYINDKRGQLAEGRESWKLVYPLLPSVDAAIKEKASALERERLRLFIQSAQISLPSESDITETMTKQPGLHKARDKSLEMITLDWMKTAEREMARNYALKAPEGEQAEFINRIGKEEYIKPLRPDIRQRTAALIQPIHRNAREAIAEIQLADYFGVFADRSWQLTGANEIVIKRLKVDQDLSIKEPKDCLKQPIIDRETVAAIKQVVLLDNTEEKLYARVRSLITEAERAWEAQGKIFLAHQQLIIDAGRQYLSDPPTNQTLKKAEQYLEDQKSKYPGDMKVENLLKTGLSMEEITGDGPIPDEKALVKVFTQRIESMWEAHRETMIWPAGVPPHASGKYQGLFNYIRQQIEFSLKNEIGLVLKNAAKHKQDIASAKTFKKDGGIEEHGNRDRKSKESPSSSSSGQSWGKERAPSTGPSKTGDGSYVGRPVKDNESWLLPILLIIAIIVIIWLLVKYRKIIAAKAREVMAPDAKGAGAKGAGHLMRKVGEVFNEIASNPRLMGVALCAMIVLYVATLIYFLNRDGVGGQTLTFTLDKTKTEEGLYVYHCDGFQLKIISSEWTPPGNIALEMHRAK